MNHHDPAPLPMYPALGIMEKTHQPLRYGRAPYWRPTPPKVAHELYVPAWNWASFHQLSAPVTTLDVNGAYLSAAGGVELAHGDLRRVPEAAWTEWAPRTVIPGYYQIRAPYWAFSATIVSPLGDRISEDTLWIAHPTLILLLELVEEGSLGQVEVLDAYACPTKTSFRTWVKRLSEVRAGLLTEIERTRQTGEHRAAKARYEAFKDGYSAALSMILTGEKCATHRPDWSHAVYAQHAATSWRKAWRYTATGRTLLRMGSVDEISVLTADLPEVLAMAKPPFRVDETGRSLGAFKTKTAATPIESDRPAALDLFLGPDQEDIF